MKLARVDDEAPQKSPGPVPSQEQETTQATLAGGQTPHRIPHLAQLQGLVGHVSPRMTMHYYRADAEAARETLERLAALG